MALQGTYTARDLIIGPGSLWFNTTPPPSGTPLSLDSNGMPPDGWLAGYTVNGSLFTVGFSTPPNEAWDNQEGLRVYAPNVMTMEGKLVQLRDMDLMRFLLPPAWVPSSDVGHWLTFGGAKPPDLRPSVLLVFRHTPPRTITQPPPAAYGYAMIYSAINTAAFTYNITRRGPAEVSFRFEARVQYSRPPEDQLGQIRTYDIPPAVEWELDNDRNTSF